MSTLQRRSGTSWAHRPGFRRAPNIADDPALYEIEQFWTGQGFAIERLASRWVFQQRDDLEREIRLAFPAGHAERFIARHTSLEVDDDLLFLHRTFP